jgi:hypothetical protein
VDERVPSALRFVVGLALTVTTVAAYVATSLWLGSLLLNTTESFFGFTLGALVAAVLFYPVGFFRGDVERRIVADVERMMLRRPAGER